MYSQRMQKNRRRSVVSFVDGWAVHTAGTGPGVVLLHANGGDHRDFDAIAAHLAATHTVHAIDLPGHGDSTTEVERTACAFADALPSVLAELTGGPFVLIGNSVGGFAAVRVAAAHPDLVRGLVLVSPGGFTPRWPGALLACRLIGSRSVAPRAMRLLPRLYLHGSSPAVVAIRRRATEASRRPDAVTTYRSLWKSFTDSHHDARLDGGRITTPTVIAWGTRDPVLPWALDGRRARRSLPRARVATFRAGHQPFAECPEEFLRAVDPFLAELHPGAPIGGEPFRQFHG